jgi:hypothetical protein
LVIRAWDIRRLLAHQSCVFGVWVCLRLAGDCPLKIENCDILKLKLSKPRLPPFDEGK